MFISHKHKIINISVPKTGSTSLHYGLMSSLEIKFHMKNPGAAIYHLPGEDIARIIGPGRFNNYFSFGIARNPYDRMVSLYHDFHDQRGQIKAPNFDDFILHHFEGNWKKNVHFLPQTFFLCRNTQVMVSQVYRFEDGIDAIMSDIGKRIGFKSSEAPHARKSVREPWQAYYGNTEVISTLNANFSDDFDVFGYHRLPS